MTSSCHSSIICYGNCYIKKNKKYAATKLFIFVFVFMETGNSLIHALCEREYFVYREKPCVIIKKNPVIIKQPGVYTLLRGENY